MAKRTNPKPTGLDDPYNMTTGQVSPTEAQYVSKNTTNPTPDPNAGYVPSEASIERSKVSNGFLKPHYQDQAEGRYTPGENPTATIPKEYAHMMEVDPYNNSVIRSKKGYNPDMTKDQFRKVQKANKGMSLEHRRGKR